MQHGDVLTAHLTGGVGAEKDKIRPVVVVHDAGRTVLAVAVTDARKRRVATHALLRGYASGTQVKDALVACEHAWSLDPTRLEARGDAPR
ncbi:MAG: type II toxin-antitoxin system PemK/MazF family toxin [Myxococcota bacterium]